MDEATVYRKALELLVTDLGTALVERRIAQAQGLLLQEALQEREGETKDVDIVQESPVE